MLKQQVVVIHTKDRYAWVRPVQTGGCHSCGGKGCSVVSISHLFRKRGACYRVSNPLQAKPGDEVQVAVDEHGLLMNIAVMFLAPLVVLITTSGIARTVTAGASYSETATILTGLIGLIFWLICAPAIFRKINRANMPVIVNGRGQQDSIASISFK